LGKATAEEVGEADSPEGFGLIQWQGQTFKRSENGSPVFAYFPKEFIKTYKVLYSLNKILTFDVSIVKR
jgi:hypothetical protein